MEFSEKLRAIAKDRGLSQSDICRSVGDISKSTVSDWFAGKVRPTIDVGIRLARILNVSLDYLADDSVDDPSPPPTDNSAVAKYLRGLDPDEAALRIAVSAALFTPEDQGMNRHIVAFLYDPKDPLRTAKPGEIRMSGLSMGPYHVMKLFNPSVFKRFLELMPMFSLPERQGIPPI